MFAKERQDNRERLRNILQTGIFGNKGVMALKRFALYGAELTKTEQEIWRQAGFDLVSEGAIDIVWLGSIKSLEGSSAQQKATLLLGQLRPKVFMLQSDKAGILPESRQIAYSVKEYGDDQNIWILGTKLEAPLQDDIGALLCEKKVTALAEVFYYYLLRDVFRETADWCGHMSSVVGRM